MGSPHGHPVSFGAALRTRMPLVLGPATASSVVTVRAAAASLPACAATPALVRVWVSGCGCATLTGACALVHVAGLVKMQSAGVPFSLQIPAGDVGVRPVVLHHAHGVLAALHGPQVVNVKHLGGVGGPKDWTGVPCRHAPMQRTVQRTDIRPWDEVGAMLYCARCLVEARCSWGQSVCPRVSKLDSRV